MGMTGQSRTGSHGATGAARQLYRVLVTETYARTLEIEAGSKEEAEEQAENMLASGQIELDGGDFQCREIYPG